MVYNMVPFSLTHWGTEPNIIGSDV